MQWVLNQDYLTQNMDFEAKASPQKKYVRNLMEKNPYQQIVLLVFKSNLCM